MTAARPLLSIPPLESGDRLTRKEFERRYHAMPHVKKAELVEGMVESIPILGNPKLLTVFPETGNIELQIN